MTKTELKNAVNARLAETYSAMEKLDDKAASICVTLLPIMHYNGALIPYKTRINWNNTVKMAALDLYDREENNPENAPTLWTDINYRDGYRIIPNTVTAAEAFSLGERGWWGNDLYESTINNNVWTPIEYPNGWTKVEV